MVYGFCQDNDRPGETPLCRIRGVKSKKPIQKTGVSAGYGCMGTTGAVLMLWSGTQQYITNHVMNLNAFYILSEIKGNISFNFHISYFELGDTWLPWKHLHTCTHSIMNARRRELKSIAYAAHFLSWTEQTLVERFKTLQHYYALFAACSMDRDKVITILFLICCTEQELSTLHHFKEDVNQWHVHVRDFVQQKMLVVARNFAEAYNYKENIQVFLNGLPRQMKQVATDELHSNLDIILFANSLGKGNFVFSSFIA